MDQPKFKKIDVKERFTDVQQSMDEIRQIKEMISESKERQKKFRLV